MAFMQTQKLYAGNNILASEIGLIQKTKQGTKSMAVEEGGRKIIKAGTVYPSNDASAEGVVFEDVDMTNDEKRPISVIIAGRVIEANLPVEVNEAAKAALIANGLHFD